ncbi:MAG: hypothetical protein ACK4MH_14295 [Brevundimonas sp.]|uniref:hypothetical protein n=1 Tax=Brevundimonas sp. TaxID=1871086 RepID=UPI003919E9FE
MSIADFPFIAVTLAALLVHLLSGIVATLIKPVWQGDTVLDRWWAPAQTARLFNVKRSEIGSTLVWYALVTARIALVIAVVSFTLDLFIN